MKGKSYLGGLIALIGISLIVVVLLVSSVQGQSNDQIGVVDMETVFTQYMASPLYEERDKLQTEFNQQMDELSDEESNQLFMEYQAQLEALEAKYNNNVIVAIEKTANEHGFTVVVDSAAILHGGVDITDDVLAELE